MKRYKIFFVMSCLVGIEAENEEDARQAFKELDLRNNNIDKVMDAQISTVVEE